MWGCRGSRNLVPPRSSIGNYTVCYSLIDGPDLYVFDAGRGLGALSYALASDRRFSAVERIHILISHAHMDHWEGLKDADWMWRSDRRYVVTLYGTQEALDVIERGYAHPSYVSLNLLAAVTSQTLMKNIVHAGQHIRIAGADVEIYKLNHFSGTDTDRNDLDTVGYKVKLRDGAAVSYFSDHMPCNETTATERRIVSESKLALFDAHFAAISEQNFGHGSQEFAAKVAREHPGTMILACHHGAAQSDEEIRSAFARFSQSVTNFRLAIEGDSYRWLADEQRFVAIGEPVAVRA